MQVDDKDENTFTSAGQGLNYWYPLPRLSPAEQIEVYKQVRRNARSRPDFFVMIALAAGIAGLGLRLDSPTTIVGAMLISPQMVTIVGLGLGVIHADRKLLRYRAGLV